MDGVPYIAQSRKEVFGSLCFCSIGCLRVGVFLRTKWSALSTNLFPNERGHEMANDTQTGQFGTVVVGGGLVGSILAVFLLQRGHQVALFEKRADMRSGTAEGGRSINLVATSRGLHALEEVGLKEEILELTVPVFGRMMHDVEGQLVYQSYSKDNTECNYSVSRAELNQKMLSCAERAGATLFFEHALEKADFDAGTLVFATPEGQREIKADIIFGTDGAGSAVRQQLVEQGHVEDSVAFLEHGYKELVIPAGEDGAYLIEKNALHIWPRGSHMLMALPNRDGSFTVTLYLANEGEESFAALDQAGPEGVKAFFSKYYADALPLIPGLCEEYAANPTGLLGTVRSAPWHYKRTALFGDAAHAIVPFFGQGMNAGFEDCTAFFSLLSDEVQELPDVFPAYSALQKPNGDAIADMALENFIEMRDRVGDEAFLLQKQVEALIGRTYPALYLSRYSMVTHSLIPYSVAQQAGVIQVEILTELCRDISTAEEVDLERARSLIEQTLTPFLQRHHITW
jgi:kynurenine 3-monooxygenase